MANVTKEIGITRMDYPTCTVTLENVCYQVAYKKYMNPLSKLRGLFSRGENKAIMTITDKDFPAKVLHSTKPVAVLFSSEGCPSCRIFKPQFKELAEKQAGMVDLNELEIEDTEIWKEYNIMSIPSVIILLLPQVFLPLTYRTNMKNANTCWEMF